MKTEKSIVYITEQEVAKILGVSTGTLRKNRSMGRGMRYYKVGTRSVRYSLDDVKQYMEGVLVEPGKAKESGLP